MTACATCCGAMTEEDAERLLRFVAWALPVVVGIVALVAGILETIF